MLKLNPLPFLFLFYFFLLFPKFFFYISPYLSYFFLIERKFYINLLPEYLKTFATYYYKD